MSKPIAEAKFYAMTAEAAVKTLQSDAGRGLSGSEAKKRLGVYGENRLQKGKKTSFAKKFMLQFGDFMVLILLIASAVSFAVSCMQGEANLADPLLILGIVIANAFVGTVQEAKAERALEALRTLSAPHADVLRDGKRAVISAEALVPGDVVYIRAGDVVPADLRLLESVHLQAEESALTGESVPSGKSANAVCDETCGAAERKNMLFSGTGISAGQGVGIVTATGMQTEMGRIAAMLGDEETPDTPLKLRLRRTGKLIGLLVLGICTVIFLIGLIQKAEPLEMFMISISLAVAAIPEGLPAIVTIVLSIGVQRMAGRNAIIRRMRRNGHAVDWQADGMGAASVLRYQSFDLVVLMHALTYSSQPAKAVAECARVLRPQGRLMLCSLARHEHKAAVEAYGHVNLGFAGKDLRRFAEKAGLEVTSLETVTRERRPPHFEVISLTGVKP